VTSSWSSFDELTYQSDKIATKDTVLEEAMPGTGSPEAPRSLTSRRGDRSVDGLSAAQRASVHLREQIFGGSLRAGDRVDQKEVAAALHISRQPVREAVLELAADGLLVVRPQHGVFVGPFDAETVRGHFELYGFLRGYAAAKVARRREPAVLEQLHELQSVIDRSSDPEAIDVAARHFYRTINIAAGNLRLRATLRSMSRFVPGNFYERYPEAITLSRRGGPRILRAIERGDADAASSACIDLWRSGGELVVVDLTARGVLDAAGSTPRTMPSPSLT
jgi:DNA-binding GntR family transcriptional regulator